MQYLVLEGNETLVQLSKLFGQQNISQILAENGIDRTPNVSEAWNLKCDDIVASTTKDITPSRKMALLNGLTSSEDVFEKACLMDEEDWKIFSATQSFRDAIKVPESVELPYSSYVMGSAPYSAISTTPTMSGELSSSALRASSANELNRRDLRITSSDSRTSTVRRRSSISSSAKGSTVNPVSSVTYRAVMNSLKNTGKINPSIFNSVNTSRAVSVSKSQLLKISKSTIAFNVPWGKIQMYSTVLKELIDFPCYPEQIETSRESTYTSMPDIIYQYEPWITFQSSGPREQSLDFHIHRDMWTGDHRDGLANKLIRFCEANTFADYNGSAVITPLIRFYIDGTLFISGVLKSTRVTWSGPIGLDNWYLEFTLSLAIQEISEMQLNAHSVYNKSIKEG